MSGWVVPANLGPGVQLPPGVQVAGMGRRVGAWFLDGLLAGFLAIIPVILAMVTGAVTLNQQAIDQIDWQAYRPFTDVTAPLFHVNTGLLILAAVVYVALNAAYYAGCWAKFGGTPCQRGLSLRVADVARGENLSIGNALLRWVLLQGLSIGIGAVFLVVFLGTLATIPANEWLGGGYYFGSTAYGSYGSVSLLSNLVSGVSGIWLIVLIVSAGTNPARRGLHDRLAGSIVVGPARVAPSWPGYPYPPQPWPGYPPQGPGYPPQAWPGYPPQGAPGYPYPPQAWPGYPPQGAPGYPYPPQAWPGYPPQGPGYPPQGAPGHPPQAAPPTAPTPPDRPADESENKASS
jgi:hypothetical protein